MFEFIEQLDRAFLLWVNQLGSPAFDPFWILATQPETWIPFYILFLFLIVWSNDRRNAILIVVSLLLLCVVVLLATDGVKQLVGRVRPNNVADLLPELRVLQWPKSYSFFSGHASSSLALSTFVFLELRRRWKAAFLIFIWPILFISSRLFAGVHYPSDIVVGALFGFLMGYLCYRVIQPYKKTQI